MGTCDDQSKMPGAMLVHVIYVQRPWTMTQHQYLRDTQTAPKKVHFATEEPHETINVQPDEQTQFSVKDTPAAPLHMLDKG